jgi:hypothetical protein
MGRALTTRSPEKQNKAQLGQKEPRVELKPAKSKEKQNKAQVEHNESELFRNETKRLTEKQNLA